MEFLDEMHFRVLSNLQDCGRKWLKKTELSSSGFEYSCLISLIKALAVDGLNVVVGAATKASPNTSAGLFIFIELK